MNISGKHSAIFLIVLSLLCTCFFYVAWNEPTVPDDIALIPARLMDAAKKTTDQDKRMQLFDSLKSAIDFTLGLKPQDPKLKFYLGTYYSLTRNYGKTISVFNDNLKSLDSISDRDLYIKTKMQIAANYFNSGKTLLETHDTTEGMQAFYQSFNYVPYYAPAVSNVSLYQINNNRRDSAKQLLIESIKLFPDTLYLINLLGFAYFTENNLAEAKKYFLKTLESDPHNADAIRFLNAINGPPK